MVSVNLESFRASFCVFSCLVLSACGIDQTGLGTLSADAPGDANGEQDAGIDALIDANMPDVALDVPLDVQPDAPCVPRCDGDALVTCDGPPRACDVTCDDSMGTPMCMTLDIPNLGAVSFQRKPPLLANLTLSDVDTDACEMHPAFYDVVGQGNDAPGICVLGATEVVATSDVVVSGSRALAIVGQNISIQSSAAILADADGETPGPGGYPRQRGPGAGGTANDGGGGGGMGGMGGRGGGDTDDRGQPGELVASLEPFIGGSGGGNGNDSGIGPENIRGGAGGGAVLLAAFQQVSLAGRIDISGGGGASAERDGGGGGAGGALLLVAGKTVTFSGEIVAGGGEGGCGGNTGAEPVVYDTSASAVGCGGDGGYQSSDTSSANAWHGGTEETSGFRWGGGGGGGAGLMQIIAPLDDAFPPVWLPSSSAVVLPQEAPTLVSASPENSKVEPRRQSR